MKIGLTSLIVWKIFLISTQAVCSLVIAFAYNFISIVDSIAINKFTSNLFLTLFKIKLIKLLKLLI